MNNIWFDINISTPDKSGWFLAAVNPANYPELGYKDINDWREKYGCTKAWFNNKKWWEPDPHGKGTTDVTDRVTHWTELLTVPIIRKENNEEI